MPADEQWEAISEPLSLLPKTGETLENPQARCKPRLCLSLGETLARLNWLHLSDLRLGMHGSHLLQPEYREAFEQDLRKLHAKSGPWHVVFISGDLTLKGSPREFKLLNSTLSSLWDFLRSLGSDPCLLAVPGDHDRWGVSAKDEDLGSRASALDVRQALQGNRRAKSRLGEAVWADFNPFSTWFDAWRQKNPSPLLKDFRPGLLPGDFVTSVITGDTKVGVIGLNSTFRSSSKSGLRGIHEIDATQLEQVTNGSLREWSLQHHFLILLTHHPPSKLLSSSLMDLGNKFAFPDSILLHLCGSQPEASPHLASWQGSGGSAGSCEE